MAIYLDESTRVYLENMFKVIRDGNWIAKRFKDMLRVDREQMEKMAKCDHIPGEYVGKKTCCTKCGSYYQEGMGSGWTLKETNEIK